MDFELNNEKRVIAVDFDGTLCENKYPEIGEPNLILIGMLKEIQKLGHKIVLWTCRSDEMLEKAVSFCREQGLEFDAVNANVPERMALYGDDPRKIGADCYIDDKCVHPDLLCHYCMSKAFESGFSFKDIITDCDCENNN